MYFHQTQLSACVNRLTLTLHNSPNASCWTKDAKCDPDDAEIHVRPGVFLRYRSTDSLASRRSERRSHFLDGDLDSDCRGRPKLGKW